MKRKKILSIFILLIALSLTLGVASAEDAADNADALAVSDDVPLADENTASEDDVTEETLHTADLSVDVEYIGLTNDTSSDIDDMPTWSIVVTNDGPESARAVIVYFDYSYDKILKYGHFSDGDDYAEVGVWVINEILPNNFVNATLKYATIVNNITSSYVEALATQEYYTLDPFLGNNYDIATPSGNPVYIDRSGGHDIPLSDISVDVQAISENANEIVWSVLVTTNGPDLGERVVAYIDLSDNLKLTNFKEDAGTYMPEYGLWNIGNMTVNESRQLLIETAKVAKGPYYIEAIAIAQLDYNVKLWNSYDYAIVNDTPGNNSINESVDNVASAAEKTLPSTGNPIAMALLALLSIGSRGLKRRL